MKRPKSLTVGDHVTWAEIHPDGAEREVAGLVWALAAPVAGMSAFWCLPGPDYPGAPERPPALVSRAARRHLAGRAYRIRRRSVSGGMEWRDMWNPTGGRYVDKGEYFTETDPRSRFARRWKPPAHVTFARRPDPGAVVGLDLFFQICDQVSQGADLDLSVGADDAAAAADTAREAADAISDTKLIMVSDADTISDTKLIMDSDGGVR